MQVHAAVYAHSDIKNQTNGTKLHAVWWQLLLADSVNLCVRVMGVSSFWQTAAQHTFQSNFHKYTSPSLTSYQKLWKLVNFRNLARSSGLSTGLPRNFTSVVLFFFFFWSALHHLAVLLSLPCPFCLRSSCFTSSSFHHPSIPLSALSIPPFLCNTPLSDIPLPFNSHTEVAPQRESEKKGKGDGGGERELPFNLKRTSGRLWSAGCSGYSLFPTSPCPCLKTSIKQEDAQALRCLNGGTGPWNEGCWIRKHRMVKMLLAKQAGSSDSKLPWLCLHPAPSHPCSLCIRVQHRGSFLVG